VYSKLQGGENLMETGKIYIISKGIDPVTQGLMTQARYAIAVAPCVVDADDPRDVVVVDGKGEECVIHDKSNGTTRNIRYTSSSKVRQEATTALLDVQSIQ
jgi:hypothetical protein